MNSIDPTQCCGCQIEWTSDAMVVVVEGEVKRGGVTLRKDKEPEVNQWQ